MGALQVHHQIPRCLLRMHHEATRPRELDGAAIQAALDWDHEAMRYGLDPDISGDELAAIVEGSTVEITAEEHRAGHTDDFRR